jgi:FixJ family two-component response regulator
MREHQPAVLVIVDDDPPLLAALKFSLEVEGFEVRAYATAESLLAEREFPELGCLILDYQLPGLDGLELLARLRSRGVTMPAVLITTPNPRVLARAAAANVPVVPKPLLTDALLDTVRRLVNPDSSARG